MSNGALLLLENMRYLLWVDHGQDREKWVKVVMAWFDCSHFEAASLVSGDAHRIEFARILETLVRKTNVNETDLTGGSLCPIAKILPSNIDYLFAGLDHGQRNEFAKSLGVDVSTISRWRRGKLKPSADRIRDLHSCFGLSHDVDLQSTPLFLSPFPVSQSQRRDWLKRRIDELTLLELNELFPALRRLLGGARGEN